jgi:4,5-dihydroxyphthalate decarboxylase
MTHPSITLAVDNYDRHAPLLDGTVRPAGFDLTVLEVGQAGTRRHGEERHERMLTHGEFDCAEVSLSSYLMARDRGAPFVAIPVFTRRLFSPSQMYCSPAAGVRRVQDLVGKRVGIQSYQTTLTVLAKGDLAHEYGVAL